MDSEKYKKYRDIFIEVKKYNECEYVAFAYGFDGINSGSFDTEEDSLNAITKVIDAYLKKCADQKIIPRTPTPSDCDILDSLRGNRDIYGVANEECINLSESLFAKKPGFALSAMLNKTLVYRKNGDSVVDFSKFLRESKFVDANKCVVFAPLTKKIYDIYYVLNYLYGIFQIYIDSTGLLIVEYDRRKIEYGHVYELEYVVDGESKGRGYLVIRRHGLFDDCEFKGFHNLMDDYQYRSNSVILEDYQVLSKLLPDSDRKIHEKAYKLIKFRLSLLFRQSIEVECDEKAINKFLNLVDNTFFYFLNQYVFKYKEFLSYEYENMRFDKYKVYSNGHKFIEDAKIYKQKHEQDVLMGIVGNGCQDEIEFEILKKYLAGTEFVGVNSKRTFDGFKASVANAAWAYVGRKSDANEILSIIAISKINGESDNEIYDKVKDMENFVKIYELLGIRSIKQGLEYTDKFIKRIINKYVARLADEYHIPKPALRKRSVT